PHTTRHHQQSGGWVVWPGVVSIVLGESYLSQPLPGSLTSRTGNAQNPHGQAAATPTIWGVVTLTSLSEQNCRQDQPKRIETESELSHGGIRTKNSRGCSRSAR